MKFNNKSDLYYFLNNNTKYLGHGSEAECYNDKTNVYKIYYEDEEFPVMYSKDEVLQFKNIDTSTFVFPNDVIFVKNELVGIISKYVKADTLFSINPLTVPLNDFIDKLKIAYNDIKYISELGVITEDIPYNTLLGDNIYIVDTESYRLSNKNSNIIYKNNIDCFNYGIMSFLTSGLFECVIKENKILNQMQKTYGKDISVIEYLKLLKDYLSSLVGKQIETLEEAKAYTNYTTKYNKLLYQRGLVLKPYK